MSKSIGVDKTFLFLVISLTAIGFAVFLSASMGILAKDSAHFSSIVFRQAFLGIILGFVFCFIFSKINYKIFKKHALLIFVFSLLLTVLVFVPKIGLSLNGAKRWISIFGFSLQPVAVLNLGFVIYWSAWLSFVKDKVQQFKYGLLPLIIILSIIGAVLLSQPDTDSFLVICFTGIVMFIVAGGRFKHVFVIGLIGVVCLTVLAFSRPYIMSRIESYFNPSANSLSSGYHLQQSLIAVGSGQVFGRGLGQSIQKFKFLPESIGDSIFAVLGEELGFVGCVFILCFFLFLIFRGFRIAIRAPDSFGGLLVVGIVIIIMSQSLINITSVLGIIPISGIPLAFFSQGGTAMFLVLIQVGIILNVSKHVRN